MNRFFVNKHNILEEEDKIIINNLEDIKHITKVLRLTIGDKIEICNMENIDYIVSISRLDKRLIECKIDKKYNSNTESFLEIVLFQAIPKSSKMDLIIQKNTEIGVRRIVPVISERCVVKIKDKSLEMKKIDRWQKIAVEASKQCKRGFIPSIDDIIEIKDIGSFCEDLDMVIIPYEEEKNRGIKEVIRSKDNIKKIGIIIGPEGGFTKEEILEIENLGGLSVSLGPRILRTETAGLVATSIIMYELGDLGGK
ncbi:16S rRNA (uracil(1498)-N(3))-methyltransferase [Paramaledivibacter caminithermalis]|jgi:16S rRNA (uracil1498-N3)-methyltransferase|uniref:Ribosomal RNA small subunit methyltransferase E n=1 Tax=Paramaledivibacter caminithermalis (strain DSM 15212 / CIP 107654 / DViRD3) TaxID=1121301 RepID=A0A1M6M6U6_PARC5|nr:16S rRNA (uracil(1498)-N(3))-methyltransferase [Paramaledivibacter caminithermalis]SHJ79216.1 16S rRNA (uracil1498-N3)-methyltransferase [Paramaledivibacter caminithermalis DSM 15212]